MAIKIGTCVCSIPDCSEVAEVREMKGNVKGAIGRLYLFCPSCGMVQSRGQKLQDYINKNSDLDKEIDFIPLKEESVEPEQEKPTMWSNW